MIETLDGTFLYTPTTASQWHKAVRPRSKMRTKPLTQYEKGRTCSLGSCRVVLSMYNKAEVCFEHQPRKVPRIRGRLYQRGQ